MKKKTFQNLSIRNKILVYFILLIVLAILQVFFPIYQKTFRLLRSYTEEQAINTVNQSGIALDNTLDSFNYMADFIAYSGDVQSALKDNLNTPYPNFEDIPYNYFFTIERILVTNYSSLMLNRIDIFGDNGMIFEVPNHKPSYSEAEIEKAREIAHQEEGRVTWTYFRNQEYSLLKEIRNITNIQEMGCVLISVKQDYLNQSLESSFLSGNGSVVVLDKEGNFICGESHSPALHSLLHTTTFDSQDFSKLKYGEETLLVTSRELPSKGLILYGLIPEAALYKDVNNLIRWIILVITLILLVILLCALIFSNSLTKPLRKLKTAMDTASEGDFSYRLTADSEDEVGQLSQQFNKMQIKINDLIDNVYRQKLLQKEAEFQMLQAQINPHFIYNVLDTITWTAHAHQMDEMAEMVSSFSKLLRISISKKRDITVREEIGCIQNYLFIQKVRYKDRISAVIDVDPELYSLIIPKLILEPLVENSVVHGLENKDGKGLILLRGELKDDLVLFTIKDNGVGISKDRIQEIMNNDNVSENAHTGLGILTVHRRIQHVYGPDYGIEIQSAVGEGTKIFVRFPYRPMEFFDGMEEKNVKSPDCR